MKDRPPKKRGNRLFATAATAAVLIPIAAVAALGDFSPPEFASRASNIGQAVTNFWDTARKRSRGGAPNEVAWRRPASPAGVGGGMVSGGSGLGMHGTAGGRGIAQTPNAAGGSLPGFVLPPIVNGTNAGSFGAAAGLGNRNFDSAPTGWSVLIPPTIPPLVWLPPGKPDGDLPGEPLPWYIPCNPVLCPEDNPGGPYGPGSDGPGGTDGPGGPGKEPGGDHTGGGLTGNTLGGPDHLPAVPEPETWVMLVAGIGLIAGLARRRNAADSGQMQHDQAPRNKG